MLAHDHQKALNVLMSHSTPLVRKRQVMRLSFGDYRTKMAEEERKLSKGKFTIIFLDNYFLFVIFWWLQY